MSAYEELLPHGYHPSYFLYLNVPANTIDINIHPTKTEVKFDNERDLYAMIRSTVKHSLGQYNVVPALDFDRDPGLDTPYSYKDKPVSTPKIEVDPSFNPFENEKASAPSYRPKKDPAAWEVLFQGQPEETSPETTPETDQTLFDTVDYGQTTLQVQQKYIVSTIHSGMVLIDQNAAHQRILYEELLEKITISGMGSQQLLFPTEISFPPGDLQILREMQSDLESAGIHFEITDSDTIKVTAIPVALAHVDLNPLFENLIENFHNDIPGTFSQLDRIARSMAKSAAIKKGTPLNQNEQEELVNRLFRCKEPNFSPFGKKTYITLELNELETRFNQ